MDSLNCKICGGHLIEKDGLYLCQYCGAQYAIQQTTNTNYNTNIINCYGVTNTGEVKSDPRKLVIGDNVTTIKAYAYENNLLLEEVVFSSNTFVIEEGAFEGCINLKRIRNYGSVKHFGKYCFKGTGLREVIIGENVETIGTEAFSNMPNLIHVFYKPNKNIKLNNTFIKCPNLREVSMNRKYFFPAFTSFIEVRNNPDNIRSTYKDAFWNTPYYFFAKEKCTNDIKNKICPDCGGKIKKGLFHAICKNCGIDLKS